MDDAEIHVPMDILMDLESSETLDPWKNHQELLDNDEISAEEQGFMIGWMQAADDEADDKA